MEAVFAPGSLVGHRYQIVERLGAGGMGVVFLATDRLTQAQVALKCVLSPSPFALHGSVDWRSETLPGDSLLAQTLAGPALLPPAPADSSGLGIGSTRDVVSVNDPGPRTATAPGRLITGDRARSGPSYTDPSQIERNLTLSREFATLASLRHPHIVSVFDYGFEGERPFFTMEYLQHARDLCKVATQATLQTRVELLAQVAQALAYLHRRGIVHRALA